MFDFDVDKHVAESIFIDETEINVREAWPVKHINSNKSVPIILHKLAPDSFDALHKLL
ncbi:MAG: hypothetical protein RXO71_05015 [Nitrososphaeria archaeon]